MASLMAGTGLAALVALQFAIVVGRMVVPFSFAWGQEAVVYLHACVVTLGIAWTFRQGRHVRIDIFRESRVSCMWRVALGALTAVCALGLAYLSLPYAVSAWAIGEGSREVGGLPGLFLLKSLIPLFAILLGAAVVLHLAVRRDDTTP